MKSLKQRHMEESLRKSSSAEVDSLRKVVEDMLVKKADLK